MRAWQVGRWGEPGEILERVELELPEPGPGQVRIKVAASGIGLPDVLLCRGTYPLAPPLPYVPGQEATGTVTAVGEGVGLAVGDRVMGVTMFWQGSGSFADECLMDAEGAFPVPEGLSDAQASGFWIPNMTGWIGLVDRGHLAEGEWLAVLGAAGGSGIAAVQLGVALGARVIAVVSDEERAAFCRSLGAEVTVDHTEGPLGAALRAATGGRGVDVIYDPVGGAPAEEAATALARHGRLLAVGFASGRWPVLEAQSLVLANASLVGVFAGGYSRAELQAMFDRLQALVASGQLKDAVTGEVGFDDLPAALQELSDRRVVGKRVLVL